MKKVVNAPRSVDDYALIGGIVYVILPIIIFACGWLKWFIAIPVVVILVLFGIKMWIELSEKGADVDNFLFTKENGKFWIITASLVFIWVYLSGIGSWVFQNSDHWVRNPIFRDLSTLKWPVIYDLSKESDLVQSICGDSKVAFSYYFCFWLPVAGLSKLLHLGEIPRNVLIVLWAAIGILDVIYLICRKHKKCSLIVPVCFIFFSGLDAIPTLLLNKKATMITHIEWWSGFFQYSSNTTQLFWVFNQSIPLWVLMALFLNLEKSSSKGAAASLTFAYSPWATIGVLPIAVVSSIKKGKIKSIFNPLNILVPAVMLLVFGSFYMGGNGTSGKYGLVFMVNDEGGRMILMSYLMFVLFEVLVFFFAMGKYAERDGLYYTVLAELLIFPFIVIKDYNFLMRGTIPALFLLNFFVIQFLVKYLGEKDKEIRLRYILLVAVLLLGALTPMHEILRTVKKTMKNDEILEESIVTFSNIQTDDEGKIRTASKQFFIYDYNDKFFFKYLGKK